MESKRNNFNSCEHSDDKSANKKKNSPYDYDYFISYSHENNKSEDNNSGFVDEFVKKLQNSKEHQQMFGGTIDVFFDKSEIHDMADWDNRIRSSLARSRFLIVLLSPSYFKSEYCAREFDWWMQHEMHRRVLGEGTAPMLIVDVVKMYDYRSETIPDIPENLQTRFPNWLSQIRKIQSGPKFDIHNLDRAKISDALDSLREEVKDRVRRQEAAQKSPRTGQYPRYNENFVGRRENLRSLRKSLSEKAAASYSALTGLGGFGKTELALTYGHAFAWDYQLGRVFAKCENKTSISETLLTSGIAEMHGWELPDGSEEQQLTFLFNHLKVKRDKIIQQNAKEDNLSTLGAHLLLILDNVNKLELISKKNLAILPDCFHVIITTRENTNEFPYIHQETVERLSEDESVELLSNLQPFANSDEAKAGRKIATLLAGFTLAVELTGAYLEQKKHITYQKQYERLVNNHAETFQKMADKIGDLTLHAAETVSAVLESTLSALSDDSRKALDYAAVMVPDTVALGWIPEFLGLDEDDGWDVIDELTGYSLLTPLENEPNIARIHRLVADTVIQKIPKESQKEINAKIREKCNALLEMDKRFWYVPQNVWNIEPVSEFCLMLAEQWTIETSEEEIDLNLTDMLNKSGKTLKLLGSTDAALSLFREFMRISNERASVYSSPAVHRDVGLALSALGDMDYMAGKMESAIEFHTQAFTIRKSLAETQPDNIEFQCDLTDSYKFLGNIERDKGNAKRAKEFYSEILKIYEKFAAAQDNNLLRNLSSSYERLGNLENAAGNADAAREWYEKSLELDQQLVKMQPNNVDDQRGLSFSYMNLGYWEIINGNTETARGWYEKTLEIRKRLADQMPENVQTQRDLSYSYMDIGNLEEDAGNADAARGWYEKSREIRKRLSEMMPENIQTLRDLSNSYMDIGDLEYFAGNTDAAREWYEKMLDIRKRAADQMPENVDAQIGLSISYERLGDLERDAGNADAAREWYEKKLKTDKQLVNTAPENVDFQRNLSVSYYRLGELERDTGNADAARAFYWKSLEISNWLAEKTPENVDAKSNLSISYERLGDLENSIGNTETEKEEDDLFQEIRFRQELYRQERYRHEHIMYCKIIHRRNCFSCLFVILVFIAIIVFLVKWIFF